MVNSVFSEGSISQLEFTKSGFHKSNDDTLGPHQPNQERATQMLTNSSLQTSQTIICSLVLAFRTMSIDTKVCAKTVQSYLFFLRS